MFLYTVLLDKVGFSFVKKGIKYGWIVLCYLALVLFLILSFYNCPASDDYTYARWMREWGFADAQITIYFAWGGRYFSNILLTLFNSLSYSNYYEDFLIPYQLHSVVHIILFALSTFILFQRIKWIPGAFVSIIPIVFFIQKANIISEFFFWMAGAVTYCSGYIFGVLAIASYIDLSESRSAVPISFTKTKIRSIIPFIISLLSIAFLILKYKYVINFLNHYPIYFFIFLCTVLFFIFYNLFLKRKNNYYSRTLVWLILSFCLFGCAGSSELSGVLLLVALVFLRLYWFQLKNWRSVHLNLPILLCLVALAINVFAPATANRQSTVDEALIHHWDQALRTGWFIFSQLSYIVALLPIGITLTFLLGRSDQIKLQSNTRFFLLATCFLATVGLILPVLITYQSGELPLRAVNAHVLCMALTMFLIGCRLGVLLVPFRRITWIVVGTSTNIVFLIFFLLDPGRNTIRDGFFDLYDGRASAFKEQYIAQQNEIRTCKGDTCKVSPITARPSSLCTDPNPVVLGKDLGVLKEYKTYSYAFFYGKKFIFQE